MLPSAVMEDNLSSSGLLMQTRDKLVEKKYLTDIVMNYDSVKRLGMNTGSLALINYKIFIGVA